MDSKPSNIKESSGPRPISIPKQVSGAAMDRKVEKPKWPLKTIISVLTVVMIMGSVGWYLYDQGTNKTFTINSNRVVASSVNEGLFEDFIPIRGRVTPKRTVYLDAIEGGRVEKRLVEDGASVTKGELIVTLSNTSLQLDVARNEAMVTEQLNNMRTLELQLEQNRLGHKRNLVELDYQIQRLGRQVSRLSDLDQSGVSSKSQLEDAKDELTYYQNSKAVTLESQKTDARLQETQLVFLRKTAIQLEDNLAISRSNLDSLNVRAPVDGKLSGLNIEVGQSIQRGGRIGQIDDPDQFKLRAFIDEYYLSRIDIGQSAFFERDGDNFAMTVSKIYPQVKNGQFEIDLQFNTDTPEEIRRGQTIQARLTLGDSTPALLIPNGAFFQDTGGNWMFVVSDDGTEAIKRNVKLGRRNSRYIEVLEGLEKNEQVITSPYSAFKEMDRLRLNAE